jgi:GH25 family lysozyme M1 (1,4-beta-N-acetylmuramidase)
MAIPSTHPRPPSVRRRAVVALTLAASLVLALAGPAAARRGDGAAGTSGEAGNDTEVPIDPRLGPTIPGIDVSHWQGVIDWEKVAGAGKRFVFLKATDGQDYIDPTFAANRAGARENGLMVGAYHFARPDDSAGDATKEAQFFVEVADPKPGHLLPVLDIETNGGLNQNEMTAWAHRFVMEVRDLTGVMPLVYTSPYGWLDRFGDSHRLARDGAPLWVAHWGVSSPTLPAGDWDGRGWVVWQHSSTGHVAGIGGAVDLDVLAGASLGRIAIRRLTVQVDGGAGGVTTAPVGYGCRTTCDRNVDPDMTITLTASPDEGAYFSGWGGDCSGTGLTCTITTNSNRTVTAGFVNDITPPVVSVATPSGLSDPAVVRFDESVRGVNPSNVVLRAPGQLRVDAIRVCRNDDGEVRDCDANVTRTVQLIPKAPLVPGRDYIVVVNPDSATSLIKDRVGNVAPTTSQTFEAARIVEQQVASVERRPASAWHRITAAAASGGTFITSDRADAAVRLTFEGTGVDWRTVTGPNQGRARVYVDGALERTVDLYAATRTVGSTVTIGGFADHTHTIRIVVTGTKRRASAGRWVAVDRFDVL